MFLKIYHSNDNDSLLCQLVIVSHRRITNSSLLKRQIQQSTLQRKIHGRQPVKIRVKRITKVILSFPTFYSVCSCVQVASNQIR